MKNDFLNLKWRHRNTVYDGCTSKSCLSCGKGFENSICIRDFMIWNRICSTINKQVISNGVNMQLQFTLKIAKIAHTFAVWEMWLNFSDEKETVCECVFAHTNKQSIWFLLAIDYTTSFSKWITTIGNGKWKCLSHHIAHRSIIIIYHDYGPRVVNTFLLFLF